MDSNQMNQFENSSNNGQGAQGNTQQGYAEVGQQYQQSQYYTTSNQQYQQNNPYMNTNQQYQSQYPYPQTQQELEEPVSLGEWLVTFLIMLIPCANIIMMFIWAFSDNEKKSKSNYFKASLIWFGIVLALYLVIFVLFAGMIGSLY